MTEILNKEVNYEVIRLKEIDIMKRAKMYLDKLSEGINPLDGTRVNSDDIVNNERISRCFNYISTVLEDVINNGGTVVKNFYISRTPFSVSYQQLENFEYSDTPISLSEIVKRINNLIDSENMVELKATAISEYLVEIGILKVVELSDGKKYKAPTEFGYKIGITVENRTSLSGHSYDVNLYSKNAQQFIIDNLRGIIEKNNTKKSTSQKDDTLQD